MSKILLVEDDKSLREIYGVRLLAEGYDIVSAGDGEEALAMAIKDRPDLIVSDVMMPKISDSPSTCLIFYGALQRQKTFE